MNKFMEIAYREALKAYKKDEIPVGAVVVRNNKIIAKSHNNRQKKYNLLGHAEINCLIKAGKKIKDWRLDECDMYVTLAPCKMCLIHIQEARIKNVYYLLNQQKIKQNIKSVQKISDCHNLSVEYENKIKEFFGKLRK